MNKILTYAVHFKNQLINSFIINRIDKRAKKNIKDIEDKDLRIDINFLKVLCQMTFLTSTNISLIEIFFLMKQLDCLNF